MSRGRLWLAWFVSILFDGVSTGYLKRALNNRTGVALEKAEVRRMRRMRIDFN
jgi:hypothetical protein